MLRRLPYRYQIPLGLALAVAMSVLLVSVVAAQISAGSARRETLATVHRALNLLATQGLPLLATDDTWRAFTLLQSTAALLPGAADGHSRAALLDAAGHYLAGSDPQRLPTGARALGGDGSASLPAPQAVGVGGLVWETEHSVVLIDPVRSEDGQLMGFVLAEIDHLVFRPDWVALAQPAVIGAVLAALLLGPLGWWVGRRMALPVAHIAECIAEIGRSEPAALRARLPRTSNPELLGIQGAVLRLLDEMQARQHSEQRAMAVQRLAAVGRLTAAVAHEINNPLAGLLTAVRTMRLRGDDAAVRERALDLLERGLHQIRTMTAALLPQARIEDRAASHSDIGDVLTLIAPTAEQAAVALHPDVQLEAPLQVPSAVLRQVLLNLLLNAIKAAGAQGQVSARLRVDAQALSLCVSNTGAQLAAQDLADRISAENGNDPRGFGLWICQELALRYRGGFDAAAPSAPYLTCLHFWLPNQSAHDETHPADH